MTTETAYNHRSTYINQDQLAKMDEALSSSASVCAERATAATTTPDLATDAQRRLMFALWREAGLTDRDSRLWVSSLWLGRLVESSRSLTRHEASVLIDLLQTTDCPSVDDVDGHETHYDPEEGLF